MPAADREGALALLALPGVGPRTWRALVTAHSGDVDAAAAARGATNAAWAAARRAARAAQADAARRGLVLHLPGDAAYPAALLDLPDPPVTLFTLGDAGLMARAPRVAVVGTRQYTPLGERTTRRLVGALREAGAVIVSGLARGIDTVAHAAALAEGLPTVAVLGTGADVPYPAGNAALHARIAAAGCVAAEAAPGATATRGAFPRRNRIVAALADLVIVVEAGAQSGALITAGIAADLGRPVAAAPGSMESASAVGTNQLLRDGAHVLADPADAPALLGLARTPGAPPVSHGVPEPADLTDDERVVWRALAVPAPDADALAERAGLSARRCAAALATMELRGCVAIDLLGETRRERLAQGG
jgi:DNA processing protein